MIADSLARSRTSCQLSRDLACLPTRCGDQPHVSEVRASSVLREPLLLTFELLWLIAKQLAELLWREHIPLPAIVLLKSTTITIKVHTEPPDTSICIDLFLGVPIDIVGSDCAAGDPWTSRAELSGVILAERTRCSAIIVEALVNRHRLPHDILQTPEEAWLLSELEVEGPVAETRGAERLVDREAASEVTRVVVIRRDNVSVEAVSLARDLEVLAT